MYPGIATINVLTPSCGYVSRGSCISAVPLLFGLLWPEDDLSLLVPLGAKLCFGSLWSCMEYSARPRNTAELEPQPAQHPVHSSIHPSRTSCLPQCVYIDVPLLLSLELLIRPCSKYPAGSHCLRNSLSCFTSVWPCYITLSASQSRR